MAPPASRRTQQAPSGRRNTRSVRSGRRIPPEVLTMVCSHLIRDGALGTLAAMMRTGSHGYSAAGPVLYASIAIDDSFPSLLVGVEARRKRALLACVQHVSFGVTDHKMLDACFASIVQAVGTGDVGDVVSDKRELFPSVRGVHIASHAYAALALDRANTFFLRTYFRPRVVCIDYPSPVAVEGLVAPLVLRGKRVRDAYRELPPEPAPDAQRHFSARGVRGARQRAQVEERKEARAKAVAEVLGNPLALDELLQLWGSEEVTLHDFRFFDWAQGEGALSSDRHVDVLSWATGRVCIFAPTPTTEHLEGQEWPGFQCALKDVGRGRACTCNNKELWRHAARFLAGVHEQQGRLLYAQHARGSTAAPPATHTHTSNQADARALQRRPEPAPVVRVRARVHRRGPVAEAIHLLGGRWAGGTEGQDLGNGGRRRICIAVRL